MILINGPADGPAELVLVENRRRFRKKVLIVQERIPIKVEHIAVE